MLVSHNGRSEFTISGLTAEQLGTLRYTLEQGTDKLEASVRINKFLNEGNNASLIANAKDARRFNEELEEAVQKWTRCYSYAAEETGVSAKVGR